MKQTLLSAWRQIISVAIMTAFKYMFTVCLAGSVYRRTLLRAEFVFITLIQSKCWAWNTAEYFFHYTDAIFFFEWFSSLMFLKCVVNTCSIFLCVVSGVFFLFNHGRRKDLVRLLLFTCQHFFVCPTSCDCWEMVEIFCNSTAFSRENKGWRK